MKNRTKKPDFTGTDLYIGIDVHLKSWKITIRLRGFVLNTISINPSPMELLKNLKKNYPNANYYSAYEAGFCGFWIHRELCKLGINNIVVNAADIPTTHKEKTQKTDKRDSRKIARELADGSLEAIYVPSPAQESLRLLSRYTFQNSKRITQMKCRIKQFLHTQGIQLPKNNDISHWSRNFINWLKMRKFEFETSQYHLNNLIYDLEIARMQRTKHLMQIRKRTKNIKTIKLLRTVPGVGQVTAFCFYTEIMDISRFQKLDHLISYLGLIPSVESSGDNEKVKGLTKRCNHYLRYLIIEAAWIAVRTDPAMTQVFNKLNKEYRCSQKAIIRIAKKLVNRMRFAWINQQPYVKAVIE